jgi:hypothetical protein
VRVQIGRKYRAVNNSSSVRRTEYVRVVDLEQPEGQHGVLVTYEYTDMPNDLYMCRLSAFRNMFSDIL